MKEKHKKHVLDKNQQLENYNILNTIIPRYLKNYYPYTDFNPEKILLTQKKMSLLVKKYDKYSTKNNKKNNADNNKKNNADNNKKNNADNKNNKKGGSNTTITFYG
jgi:hypothetical protein